MASPAVDILSAYGVKIPEGVDAVPENVVPAQPSDAGAVLKGYGVKVPAVEPTVAPAVPVPNIANAPPGKVPEIKEDETVAPTKREAALAKQRGLGGQLIGGMPIAGPALNMLAAATDVRAGEGPWWDRYVNALDTQRRADKHFAQEHPVLSTAAQFAGGAAGFGPMALTGPGRALLGISSTLPWGTRVYMGAGGGAAINALDAGMRGENPLTAAEIGAAGGVLGPTAGEGARAGVRGAANYLYPRPKMLQDVPRPGINLLANALEGETPASIAANRKRMGPAGFFGDLNQMTTDITGGISDLPIPARTAVQEAYRTRAAQQGDRIEGAVTRATGIPANFNVVEYEKFLTEARAAASDPLYEQWRSTQVHPTKQLQSLIPRLEKAGAFDMAEELSGVSGRPIDRKFFVGGPQKDFPTTEAWDYVKRGLDRRIDQAYAGNDKTLARELVSLKGQLISEIEKTPAGQIWKQARGEFADRSALIDQLAAGRDTFLGGRSGLTPDELREELQHLSRPELVARVQGMRAAVRDALGDKTDNASRVRSQLLSENNQKKMRLLIGDKSADEMISTLESEKYLADKQPAVIPNMSTGASGVTRAERRGMFMPPEVPSAQWNIFAPSTYPGAHHLNPRNVLQSIINDRYARVAPELAPIMLTPEGPQMDDLIRAISGETARMGRVRRASEPAVNALQAAIAGPGQSTYRRQYESRQP